MTHEIPTPIVRAIRNRNGLLWVCQRYDLEPRQNPHDNSPPRGEAILRYRKAASKVDVSLDAQDVLNGRHFRFSSRFSISEGRVCAKGERGP